jgi:FkbM family methyltransferase
MRGSGLVVRGAHRLGLLKCVVRYPVGGGLSIDVPLYRRANQWDARQVVEYEAPFLDAMAAAINRIRAPVTFIDCGADIGLFSVGLVARCRAIGRVIAFEPDPLACELLARNLARLPCQATVHQQAVGAKCERGELVGDPSGSEHAQYVTASDGGSVEIVALDDAMSWDENPQPALALKIDVEGQELAVLQGAERLLRGARQWVVGFEAHRLVALRTGIDPIECARYLRRLRACRFTIAERPEFLLSLERGFFEQTGGDEVLNIVATGDHAST